jgi:hypothetical protein
MTSDVPRRFRREGSRIWCQKFQETYLGEMLRSREVTVNCLTHADPRARECALLVIRDYWDPPPDYPQICERLALQDDDTAVRALAILLLSSSYYNTWDARIGKLLACIVRDEAQPLMCRRIAYFGLFMLQGAESANSPNPKDPRFPETVDWKLVESFCQ